MASFEWPPAAGAGTGVSSLDGITGDITLIAGTGISITDNSPSAGDITITATGPTSGNLTDAGTDGITITGGTGAVLGSGTSIAQHVADSSHNGYLSSTDWSTFNGKQAALTIGNLTDAGTDGITVTGGTGAVIGSGTSISQHVADTSHNGYLSSTDWNTFNGKGSGTVTAVSVVSANGFTGTSSGGATPALTLTTSVTGIPKGNGTAFSAATSGTDYSAGTSALSTGILKSTTSTGALTIAGASDIPTFSSSYETINATLAASVGSSALTVALKDINGSDPSSTSPVLVGFRNATLATGTFTVVSVTSSLSITIPSGTTIGTQSGATNPIYVYLLNNAGTAELALSLSSELDNGQLQTSSAISTGATSTTLYSTTARTSVPVRLIGQLIQSQTTAGTWAAGPTSITMMPFNHGPQAGAEGNISYNQSISADSITKLTLAGISFTQLSSLLSWDSTNHKLVALAPAYLHTSYTVSQTYVSDSAVGRQRTCGIYKNGSYFPGAVAGVVDGIAGNAINSTVFGPSALPPVTISVIIDVVPGDYLEFYYYQSNSSGTTRTTADATISIALFPR